jgi:hypothetical protein
MTQLGVMLLRAFGSREAKRSHACGSKALIAIQHDSRCPNDTTWRNATESITVNRFFEVLYWLTCREARMILLREPYLVPVRHPPIGFLAKIVIPNTTVR